MMGLLILIVSVIIISTCSNYGCSRLFIVVIVVDTVEVLRDILVT